MIGSVVERVRKLRVETTENIVKAGEIVEG